MARLLFWGSLFIALADQGPRALQAAGTETSESDWPKFRGPRGDGISTATGLLKDWPAAGPPLFWKSESVGKGFSSVSISGNLVFTMGDEKGVSWVFALERATGKIIWSAQVGKSGGNNAGTRCTPTVAGALVYAIGQFGDLVCLEQSTGKERWRRNLVRDFGGKAGDWNYTESPLIDGDKVVCTPGGQKKAAMVALNKDTGDVIWESDFGETAGYASMVISEAGGVRQYVQLLSQGVAGVSARDGKLLWRFRDKDGKKMYFERNTANIPNPVVLGDYIFAGAGYGRGAGLLKLVANTSGVKEEWIYFKRDLNSRHGGYVVIGDYVYADRDDSGKPFCAKWQTGEIQWKREGAYQGTGSVAITYADDRLYMRYDNGYVALVEANPTMYKERGIFKIPNSTNQSWAHPVVAGGKLYLREKNIVWCYDIESK